MDIVEEGLNDEFLYKMLVDSTNRMKIPMKGMSLKERLAAQMAFMQTDPYLTMFVIYVSLGPFNPVAGGIMCEADGIIVQDPLHKYTPCKELGYYTGIKRKASYQGLTVFMQKAGKANQYKHMYIKDMYDAIVDHFKNKPKDKADPIEDFLNINLDEDWYASKSKNVLGPIITKLGPGHYTSFYDVYMHYSMQYSGEVIEHSGNRATSRRYNEKLSNMGGTLTTRSKTTEEMQPIKEFLQECEWCSTVTEDPLADEILKHSGMTNANAINAFKKYLHETTEGFIVFEDMSKNLEAWSQHIKSLRYKDRTFAEDLAYRVWITRYWDETGYKHFG